MGTSNCSACCHIWNGRLVENGILISDWIDFMKSIVVIFALAYIFFGMENYSQADAALKIREGDGAYGTVILTVAGEKVHLGDSSYGDVIFTIDPPHVRDGDSSYGVVVATLGNDGQIHVGGSAYGKVIAVVSGNRVHEGNTKYGKVIATVDGGYMSGTAAATYLLLR